MACSLVGVFALAPGCASKDGEDSRAGTKPGDGIAEFRQIATRAEGAIREALNALGKVAAQPGACSPAVREAFAAEVNRLQVDSIQVRARAHALIERGDAYFERWHENMARVEEPELRARAEAQRPQLQACFQQIKSQAHQAREAFKPFLSDLRQLRNSLEQDPASLGSASQEQIKRAKENGTQAERCIAGITRELDSMQAMLRRAGAVQERGAE